MEENLPTRVIYLLNEAKHDCFFLVGPENGPTERIGSIRALLMADSEPLRVMLGEGELAETGDIRVKDVEPETFKNFLKCVYGASSYIISNLTFEKCGQLLYVFEKYLVKNLKTDLMNRLKRELSSANIFVALSHPIFYQSDILEEKISEILKYDFDKISKGTKFLELSDTAISWILQQEHIYVKEIEIWNAVVRWAEHKTESTDGKIIRSKIFDFLKYIRFLTMDYSDFFKDVLPRKVLLEDEIIAICKSFEEEEPRSIELEHLCKDRISRYNIFEVSPNVKSSITKYSNTLFIHMSVGSMSNLHFQSFFTYSNTKTYHWAGNLWCIKMYKVKKGGKKKYLSVFLECRGRTSYWRCTVNVELTLVNQCGKEDVRAKYSTTFSPSALGWGYGSFYNWSELLNPDNGFVKENTIILQAKVQIQNP